MLVDPDEHPSFYKLLLKEGSMDKILLPPAFVQENKNMLAKTCLLKTDEGVFWEAKIVREKHGYFICKEEWPQFAEYHRLELGDVLLFFLIDKSTFQVLPYTQKRYKNLRGKQVFEELSSSSKEDEDEDEDEDGDGDEDEDEDEDGDEDEDEDEDEEGDGEGEEEERELEDDGEGEEEEEEEEEETPRISKKCKVQALELSDNSVEESNDSSSGSKDEECPRYSHSGIIMKGGKSNAEADNILRKKMKAPGLELLLKACQDNPKKPAHSIFDWKLKRRREKPRYDKDPDNPKQPTTAFLIFMEEFKKQFMKENPRIHSVYVVDRAGGEKWKQLSEAEKAPYIAEAEKRKVEHQKNMRTCCMRQASDASKKEESVKSRSVVVKEDEDGRKVTKLPCMRILVSKHVISSACAVEEEKGVSEENGPKKMRSSMVNFNSKDPNSKVVVKQVTDTSQPLKTYLRRKHRRKDILCSF